jgi:hypothetical protein
MSRRAALVAAALLAPVLSAAPSAAQACQPSSAELALEELLDVAADGSPLEDQARKIADEQDARDAFETPETIRRIEELAHANDLVFQCDRRRYVPLQRPDPRDAIAEDQDPLDEGPDGSGTVTPGAGGGTAPKTPGTSVPETAPGTGGVSGRDPATGAEGGDAGSGPATGEALDGAVVVDEPGAGATGRGGGGRRSGGKGRSAGRPDAAGSATDEIAAPEASTDGGPGAVAVVPPDALDTSGLARAGVLAAAAVVAATAGAVAIRRRRSAGPPLA